MRSICIVLAVAAVGCSKAKKTDACVPRAQFPATGYFRVTEDCGAPLFVDPNGKPFFSFGVNHVNWQDDYEPSTNTYPYNAAVTAKYGTESAWAQATVQRLQQWGWNTAGAWSSDSIGALMPYTIIMNLSGSNWSTGAIPDYFDPSWEASVVSGAMSGTSGHTTDPNLIGYFLDNEIHWGPDWRTTNELLDDFMAFPSTAPGKQTLVSFLSTRYNGSITDFNTAWTTQFASFDALAQATTLPPRGTSAAVNADRSAFTTVVGQRFFSVVAGAVRAADPNHLILGIRFVAAFVPTEIAAAAGQYCDVISLNDYQFILNLQTIYPPEQYDMVNLDTEQPLEDFYKVSGKPIMISEFGWRAADSGLPNTYPPVYPTLATQADRASSFQAFATSLLASPWMVGYHWFEWADEPPGGRSDGENCNWGLVSNSDIPYTAVTTVTTMVNHWTAP